MRTIAELSAENFVQYWAVDHAHVFAPRELDENPFVNPRWRIVCICGPRGYIMDAHPHLADVSDPHERIYAALFNAIRNAGDDQLAGCLLGAPHVNPSFFEASEVLPFSLLQMRRQALDAFDLQVFGHSRRWGIASSTEEEVSMVGGDGPFMNEFMSIAGGNEVLKGAFLHCADYLLDYSDLSAKFVHKMMSLAEWTPP